MELMNNKGMIINQERFLITHKYEESNDLMEFMVKKILPRVKRPNQYTRIKKLCEKCKKFGITSYEISTQNDKTYCVILRVDLTKGVMYTGDRCMDFWDK